jgi:3'-phosphoadenosine 5'-phosphosulfate sulfotransferase (PAPS reductase)/FAD synthetase
MSYPFRITEPTCISFSGGRTSAYMLWRVLQSNGGLPSDAVVCFANTGKEAEETLEFVYQCGKQWHVRIHWVEYRPDGFAEVNWETASRNGEPFKAIIEKRQFLPNPVTRFCTAELKIRAMHKYLRSIGWTEWDQMVGIRADEQRRVAKIRARPHPEGKYETVILPLADAGVTLADIDAFWADQTFRLELPTVNGRTLAGNCDLCFLKAGNQVQTLIAQKPERAIWWADMEALALALSSKPSGAKFRTDWPSYAEMLKNVSDQTDWVGHDETIECFCGD